MKQPEKRKRGRPPKPGGALRKVTVKIEPKTFERLSKLATRRKLTWADTMRAAIELGAEAL